jgi:hypothetical protein
MAQLAVAAGLAVMAGGESRSNTLRRRKNDGLGAARSRKWWPAAGRCARGGEGWRSIHGVLTGETRRRVAVVVRANAGRREKKMGKEKSVEEMGHGLTEEIR